MISQEAKKFIAPQKYGNARFLGDDPSIEQFSPLDRVYISARRHACPRPDATIAYYGDSWLKSWRMNVDNNGLPEPDKDEIERHGIAITRRRYDECDFVTGDIISKVRKYGPAKAQLLKGLTISKPRKDDEPVGYYEPGTVPRSHKKRLSPRASQVGFALARVLIEQFGWGNDISDQRTWQRYEKGLDLLDVAIEKAETPVQLLAILAELVTGPDAQAKPEKVLSHIFEAGIQEEENNYSEITEIRSALTEFAPNLTKHMVQ